MGEIRAGFVDLGPGHASAPASARRKYLTILFSDLTGSTRLAGAMEAEDYAQLLARLRAVYLDVVPRFGGTVVQISGDGLLAMFGYPEENEDDGRTAVMAAIELHERVRSMDGRGRGETPLRLHSGVHSGLVLLHDGDAVRGRFELLGGATNIASRLANAAQADEIVVSEATLGPDTGLFQTSERRLLSLKGKVKPLAAFNVVALAPVETRFAGRERKGLKPFVGRDDALAHLASIVERATSGNPSFVAIIGPPGVGKTRLAGELLSRAGATFRSYRGECDAHLGAEPLQPFLQIIRSALELTGQARGEHQVGAMGAVEAALAALGPGLTRHIPTFLHLLAPIESGETAHRPVTTSVSAAVTALLAQLAAEHGPLALFIDDWQWSDEASRRLLESLRDLTAAPLLVLLTMRGDALEQELDRFERLALAPLSDDDAVLAIRQMLPRADPFVINDICAAAGGNPLFIEELCHSVAYGEDDFRTHGGSGWLDILIGSRFCRLADEQAHLLATAAVIGNVVPVWLLEQVTGRGEQDALVRALGENDFIFPGERPGTLRFKHGIARDVIYDSVGLGERRALHLKIAEAFRDHGAIAGEEEFYEALAYHYGAGGDAAATATYAELAAGKAMERSALDRAQFHYRAALDALDQLPPEEGTARRWQKIARRLGLASAFSPSTDHIPILEEAVERAAAGGDALALSLAAYWLGYITYGLGRLSEAEGHCQRAMATAQRLENEELKALISVLLGQVLARAGAYQSALPLLSEGISSLGSRLNRPETMIGFAFALSCQAIVLADLGRFAEARARFVEALSVVEDAEHPVGASILSLYHLSCLWQGCLDEALGIAIDAERLSVRVRALYLYMRNKAAAAYAHWKMTGAPDDVSQLLEAAAGLERCGNDQNLSSVYGWLADVMAAQGQTERARHYAARTLERARTGDRLGMAMAWRAVTLLEARRGDFVRAEHYLGRAMAAARARNSAHELAANWLCAAELALARDDRSNALAFLEQADAGFVAMGMHWHAGEAARLRASVGRVGERTSRRARRE